ncbi:hypothetical protein [Kitasatospora griseola]
MITYVASEQASATTGRALGVGGGLLPTILPPTGGARRPIFGALATDATEQQVVGLFSGIYADGLDALHATLAG